MLLSQINLPTYDSTIFRTPAILGIARASDISIIFIFLRGHELYRHPPAPVLETSAEAQLGAVRALLPFLQQGQTIHKIKYIPKVSLLCS